MFESYVIPLNPKYLLESILKNVWDYTLSQM